jgi:hypothetical protein
VRTEVESDANAVILAVPVYAILHTEMPRTAPSRGPTTEFEPTDSL